MSEQEQKLRNEILNDAKRKAERTVTRAKRDAEKALNDARAEQEAERQQSLEQAAGRGDARSRAILSTVSQEVRRSRLTSRETIIAKCLDEALSQTNSLSGNEASESLVALLQEAVAALGSDELVVRVSPKEADMLTPEFLSAQGLIPGLLKIQADDAIAGGVVVETPDGRRRFDNTHATRRARLLEPLRTLLAGDIEF
jgi:vacuolar-type H+-ATPase subunit E/Vma4